MSDSPPLLRQSVMTPRFIAIAGLVLAAAAARLLPHYPNATPVTALALFSGACLFSRRGGTFSLVAAFGLPLVAMVLSDLGLGALAASAQGPEGWRIAFHDTIWAVYGCVLLVTGIGLFIHTRRRSAWWLGAAALSGSLVFFVITNFAVWLGGMLYPRDFNGLITCYAAAIAFIEWQGHTYSFLLGQVAGDLFYTALLFGLFAAAEKFWPALREEPATGPAR